MGKVLIARNAKALDGHLLVNDYEVFEDDDYKEEVKILAQLRTPEWRSEQSLLSLANKLHQGEFEEMFTVENRYDVRALPERYYFGERAEETSSQHELVYFSKQFKNFKPVAENYWFNKPTKKKIPN